MKIRTLIRAALLAVLGLWPSIAGAQAATFFRAYDIDATSYTYGLFLPWVNGYCTIETSGSSTTTTAGTGCGNIFDPVGVGDEIRVTISGVLTRRVVTAKASGVSLTVDTAWNVAAGTQWERRDFQSGTGATVGWFNTTGLGDMTVYVQVLTLVSDVVDVSVECRPSGLDLQTANQVDTVSISSATAPSNGAVFPIGEDCGALRVGLKVGTDAGTDSVTVVLEGR